MSSEKEEKVVKGASDAKVLGAAMEDAGALSAPVKNISQLMMLSLWMYGEPQVGKKTLQKLLGSWIFPIMFRREAFAIFHQIFKDLNGLSENVEGVLSKGGRDEMLCMTLAAPLLRHNMRWPVSTTLFCHDAEGSGGSAICEAEISEGLADELWRTADVRGRYTTKFGDGVELQEAAALVEGAEGEVPEEVKQGHLSAPADLPANVFPKKVLDLTAGPEGRMPSGAVGREAVHDKHGGRRQLPPPPRGRWAAEWWTRCPDRARPSMSRCRRRAPGSAGQTMKAHGTHREPPKFKKLYTII